MSNVPAHLPGDLGEHDPRREAHPQGNPPGSGGHEVKIGSAEQQGGTEEATAAKHSTTNDPATDNTAEHAFEGASTEGMDRSKRQHNSSIPGGRTGHDGVDDHLTRAGAEQGSHRGADEYGSTGSGLTGSNTGSHTHHHGSTGSGLTGSTGSGLTGSNTTDHHGSTGAGLAGAAAGAGLAGSSTHHHGSTGSGLTGSNTSTGFTGSDPQERHQLHHGTAHHTHDFSHNHTTRTGELLDPASGRDTGIPGYTGGLTGSSTGAGLTGSSQTGSGLTGSSHTGTGLTGSSHTGTGLTGSSHTGTGAGVVAEGERALHSGTHGSTGSGLTGSQTGTGLSGSDTASGLGTSSHTGSGLTGSHVGTETASGLPGSSSTSTAEHLREAGTTGSGAGLTGASTGHHGSTGSGLTGNTTGQYGTTGDRVKEDVREAEHATGHDGTTTKSKPSLLDKLNPLKDSDGDGKKGFMK